MKIFCSHFLVGIEECFTIHPLSFTLHTCVRICTRTRTIWTHIHVSFPTTDQNEVGVVIIIIPPAYDISCYRAYPIDEYPAKCKQAAAIMHMIMNNLDPDVAQVHVPLNVYDTFFQFPQELVTYGGNGQVLSNWAQFWYLMHYLSQLTEEQTLVMYSGHPMGLFPSHPMAPRCVITNGMVGVALPVQVY